MAWIKRNLIFLILSLIALLLMGAGGWFLYGQISHESDISQQIQQLYSDWNGLNTANPHPGMPGEGKIDNVKAAQEQNGALLEYIKKIRPHFERIPPIPDLPAGKVTDADFAKSLANTIAQLQRTGEQQSVLLQHDYAFTFQAQKKRVIFDPTSLDKLAMHLGEIKAICDILFDAKINSLEFLRREPISADDNNPPDYLPADEKTIVTPLADLTPYRVTFDCFSAELASVLGGLASSSHGFVVKSINVEPSSPAGSAETPMPGGAFPTPPPPTYMPPPGAEGTRRYSPQPMAAPAAVPARTGSSSTFLNEKPLRVTLLIEIVKPKAGK